MVQAMPAPAPQAMMACAMMPESMPRKVCIFVDT